jgi:hypothetical protein
MQQTTPACDNRVMQQTTPACDNASAGFTCVYALLVMMRLLLEFESAPMWRWFRRRRCTPCLRIGRLGVNDNSTKNAKEPPVYYSRVVAVLGRALHRLSGLRRDSHSKNLHAVVVRDGDPVGLRAGPPELVNLSLSSVGEDGV